MTKLIMSIFLVSLFAVSALAAPGMNLTNTNGIEHSLGSQDDTTFNSVEFGR